MKKPKTPWLALLFFLLLMSSANPTNSQKQGTESDTVPSVKPAPVVKDSADTVPLPVLGSRLDSVAQKAVQVEKVFDKVDKNSGKMSRQLSNIQSRQIRILNALSPKQPDISTILIPRSAVIIRASPETPQIKPVEVDRPGWWKRTFGRD